MTDTKDANAETTGILVSICNGLCLLKLIFFFLSSNKYLKLNTSKLHI